MNLKFVFCRETPFIPTLKDGDFFRNLLKDPNYWKNAKEKGDFSEQDIALYYRDVWQIEPKNVVKFRNLMKLKKEITSLEEFDENN